MQMCHSMFGRKIEYEKILFYQYYYVFLAWQDARKTNQQQIALKDIVAENAGKIEETNSQVTYIGKSESQEDIDLDEKDINLDDDSDSIQK